MTNLTKMVLYRFLAAPTSWVNGKEGRRLRGEGIRLIRKYSGRKEAKEFNDAVYAATALPLDEGRLEDEMRKRQT